MSKTVEFFDNSSWKDGAFVKFNWTEMYEELLTNSSVKKTSCTE